MSLKVLADELAKHGRFGDTQLLHVHKDELAGLAALAPGGKLTINPKTGLPEAFFFLPFLASLFGGGAAAAAPAALAAATGAGAGGALASGLATGLTAASTALPAAASSALPAAAAALPAAAAVPAGVDALTTGAITAPATAVNMSPLIVGTSGAAPAAAAAAPSTGLAALTAPASSTAGISSLTPASAVAPVSSVATPGAVAAKTGAGAMMAPAPATATGIQAIGASTPSTGVGGFLGKGIAGLSNMNPLTMMMLGQGLSGMFKKGDKGEGKEKDISGENYYSEGGVDPTFPGDNYNPGKDNEWDYFRGMADGGLVTGYAQGGGITLAQPMRMMGGARNGAGFDPTALQMQGRNRIMMQPGQQMMTSRHSGGFADGGLATLANPPPGAGMLQGQPQSTMPPMQQQGQPLQPGMEPDPNTIPTSPYPKSQIGTPSDGEKELIAQTVAAIKGRHPNPQGILLAFVQQFGEQALQDLVARVKGAGATAPTGDGLSDSIPATIEGQQPTSLSEGEFVVPSDVVSHLGNGSTDAGAGHLQNMVARTRAARGAPQAPPQIDPSQMMPA